MSSVIEPAVDVEFDELEPCVKYARMIEMCGVRPQPWMQPRDETVVRYFIYGDGMAAPSFIASDLLMVLGEECMSWREWESGFEEAKWPAAESYFAGVEHLLTPRQLIHGWAERNWQLLRRAAFPLSRQGLVTAAGTYAVPWSSGQTVSILEDCSVATFDTALAALETLVAGHDAERVYHATSHTAAARILKHGVNTRFGDWEHASGRGFHMYAHCKPAAEWAWRQHKQEPAVLVFRRAPPGCCWEADDELVVQKRRHEKEWDARLESVLFFASCETPLPASGHSAPAAAAQFAPGPASPAALF